MEKEFAVSTVEDFIVDAAKMLVSKNQGMVIILDKGKPKGIITEEDLVKKILIAGKDPKVTKSGEIMSIPLITVSLDEDLLTASEIMQKNKITILPVVQNEIIYGIITATHIARSCGAYVEKATRDILRWSVPIT